MVEKNISVSKIDLDKINLTAILEIDKNILDIETKKGITLKYDLLEKDEFHVTLIGSKTGEIINSLITNLDIEDKNRILNEIENFINITNWEINLENEFYYIEKEYIENEESETRRSIIQKIKIKNLENFYNFLNNLIGTNFELPFPHITLFTNSTRIDKKLRGIGIYTENDFNDLTKEKLED